MAVLPSVESFQWDDPLLADELLTDEERGSRGVRHHVPATESIFSGMSVEVFDAGEVDQSHGATEPGRYALIEPGPTKGGMSGAS